MSESPHEPEPSDDRLMALLADLNRAATREGLASELVRWERVSPIDLVSVAIVDDGVLRFAHGDSVTDEIAADWPSAPIEADIPMADAVRRGTAVELREDEFARYAGFVDEATQLGLRAFEAHPLRGRDGVRMVIGFGHGATFGPLQRRSVDDLVRIAGQTVVRIERHERDRAHSVVLADLVLPTRLPVVDGLDLHGIYKAPRLGQRVGGDLYDAVVDDEGRVSLVIADAVGHSLGSARHLGRVRHAIGSQVMLGADPAEALTVANRYLRLAAEESYISCLVVRVDVETGRLEIANAGHPAPVALPAVGPARVLDQEPSLILGVLDTQRYTASSGELAEDECLVLYTDGVVERRDRSIDDGVAWMMRWLDRRPLREPVTIAADLAAARPGVDQTDDITVLVAKRTGRALAEEFRMRRPHDDIDLAVLRASVDRWASGHGLDVEALRLIVTELVQNARQATTGGEIEVDLRRLGDGGVRVRVANRGADFAMPDTEPHLVPGGRGLAIVEALSDEVTLDHRDGWMAVTATMSPPSR